MSDKRVDTVRLQEMSRAYTRSATLFAAIELDLFSHIADGNDTLPSLATVLGISHLNAERLTTMCVSCSLLERSGDKLRNTPDVARFLVKGEPGYAGPWMRFTKPDWNDWGNLSAHLSDQTPPAQTGMYESFTIDDARRYHEATYSIGMGAGRRFARQVDLGGRRRLLDLGGGSGAYSIAATRANPRLSAIVFDLPPVTVVTAEYISEHDLSNRISTRAGDFTRDPFPEDVDTVIMASNLPQYGPDLIRLVIKKAFDVLLPGGEMHLVGEMLDDDRTGPLDAAIWGLSEALANSTGLAHSRADCVGYFRATGFADVRVIEFIPGVLARVTGIKPKA
jgi:SAM-dependent methyltransferase